MNKEILIVGAGPSGLMMAIELKRRGVPCRIIDQQKEISSLSKAIGIQARTLEIFKDIGIAEQILQQNNIMKGVKIYQGEKNIVHMDLKYIHSEFHYIAMLEQPKTEQIMATHLNGLGVNVERGVSLLDFQQHKDRVEATLQHQDGQIEQVATPWLIGTDGPHSLVRKKSGFDFAGFPFNEQWLLADVKIDWSYSRDHLLLFLCQQGFVGAFPLPNHIWRLIIEVNDKEFSKETALSLADIQEIFAAKVPFKATISEPLWITQFRINQRRVKQYRQGRVFLAGDASHIHSPIGAQGMNTGIQDAHNLAWKLALVEQGNAHARLLDTYNTERESVAAKLLKATTFFTKVVLASNPFYRLMRNYIVPLLLRRKIVQKKMQAQLSQLNIHYPQSQIASKGAGSRAPLSKELWPLIDGRFFTLLVFTTNKKSATALALSELIEKQYSDIVKLHFISDQTIYTRYQAKNNSMALIRPDLYLTYQGPIDLQKITEVIQ